MSEWHVTPDYIMSHWTEELLILMSDKLIKRKERQFGISKNTISEEQFFKQAGIKVVKRGY